MRELQKIDEAPAREPVASAHQARVIVGSIYMRCQGMLENANTEAAAKAPDCRMPWYSTWRAASCRSRNSLLAMATASRPPRWGDAGASDLYRCYE